MSPEAQTSPWRDEVVAFIRTEALPVDKFGHQPRLYRLCREIAASLTEPCDDDILFAAAWMHDLGVFSGHRPADPAQLARWNHVPYTIRRSAELLTEWGFPRKKLPAVEEAMRNHQAGDQPQSLEATVLRDADILEQLGAVGAMRALVKVGRDTRFATFSQVLPVLQRALDQLPSELRLPRSRELAAGRIATLGVLLQAIREEAGELLF